eukprot:gb/GEZN01000954.1/.p1 GENE.gb/GEZN01000954.1/~~gb/GEZN01000954.1/.p1  ORF type:complete len:1111 (-),score=185.57 gb/GEZN01000954.1/:112-3444(-)
MQQAGADVLPQPKNAQQLEQCLSNMQLPDTAQVRQATLILKQYLQNPQCLKGLMEQLAKSQNDGVRHMAAVLLRIKIWSHYRKTPDEETKAQVKLALLKMLVAEPNQGVRRGIAALIATLAKKLVPKQQWNDLFPHLVSLSAHESGPNRVMAMVLFRALAEEIGTDLKPQFPKLCAIFAKGLQDPTPQVRCEALRAMNVVVTFFDTEQEVEGLRQYVPPIINVVKYAMTNGPLDIVNIGFELFDNISELPVDAMQANMIPFMQFLLQVAIGVKVGIDIRKRAGNLLCAFTRHKPGKVVKGQLVPHILKASIMMLCEPNSTGKIDENELNPENIGSDIFDSVVQYIPHQLIFEPIKKHCQELLADQDFNKQKGAYLMLATMAEGYGALLIPQIEGLLTSICRGLQSPHSLVRVSALCALIQFTNEMGADAIRYHAMVVPQLLKALDSDDTGVKQKACIALHHFCQGMQPQDIKQYTEPLVKKLVAIITSAQEETDICRALMALQAVAIGAEDAFLPYAEGLLKLLITMMSKTKTELLIIRAYATDCVGAIANAIGKDNFKKYFKLTFELSIKGISDEECDVFELREKTFHYWSNLALCYTGEFAPALEQILPFLLATCLSDDGMNISRDAKVLDEADTVGGMKQGDDDQDSDSDQDEKGRDEEAYRTMTFSFQSGALDMKIAAIATLQNMLELMENHMLKYIPKIIEVLYELCAYPTASIREAVVKCFGALHELVKKQYPFKVKKGTTGKMPKFTQKVLDKTIPILVQFLSDEEDMTVMALVCEVLARAGDTFGMDVFQNGLEHIVKATHLLLQQKAACQIEQEEGVVQDHDEVLIASVTRLVESMARAMGGQKFAPIFQQYLPAILAFCNPARPVMDRGLGAGCIAEVAVAMEQAIVPFFPAIFPMIFAQLRDPIYEVKRNTCFAAGSLFRSGGPAGVVHYRPVMELILPLCQIPRDTPEYVEDQDLLGCKDNALSCLAKMIAANPQVLPMETVVPLLLKGLPLQSDLAESQFVYPVFMQLAKVSTPVFLSYLPDVVRTLAVAASETTDAKKQKPDDEDMATEVPEELRRQLARMAQELWKGKQEEVQKAAQQLNQKEQQLFMAILKSKP